MANVYQGNITLPTWPDIAQHPPVDPFRDWPNGDPEFLEEE